MTLLYFILLIGVLIFVHEFGHFLFAKLFNVKVLKFSLGFGPKAAGFRRGETEYVVAWLPLGGFVKMLGEDPTEEIKPQDQGRAFHQKPLWQRYIVVFAGPAFNLIFPLLIYFVFYTTHTERMPAQIGKVFAGQPAAAAGLLPGDKVVAIEGDSVRYFEQMRRYIAASPNHPLRFTIERDGERFDRLITPRLHIYRDRLNWKREEGRVGITPYEEPAQIGVIDPSSPAGRAGLRTGDVITAINGRLIRRWADLERVLARARGHALRIAYLRPGDSFSSRYGNLWMLTPSTTVVYPALQSDNTKYETGIESAEFYVHEVQRTSPLHAVGLRAGDRVLSLDGRPVANWELMESILDQGKEKEHSLTWLAVGGKQRSARFRLRKVTTEDDYRQKHTQYVFGVTNRMQQLPFAGVPISNRIGYAAAESVRTTGQVIEHIVIGIVQMIRRAIPADTLGGPVMLYNAAGVAARKGWDHFLSIMALISINLGILNLLPIPILDGGHIMFFTIEAIKRRPLSLRAREVASYVGLLLLITLMIFALTNDIDKYILPR